MNNLTWFTATVMIGLGGFAIPAHADSLQPVPRRAPSMQELVILGPERATTLNRLVVDIEENIQASGEDGITTVDDVLRSTFINDFLDENGEFNLPLGITVYDTMGDTSVGVSTQF
jgi:hypothetical protein